jgi:hypothetical protein
VKRCREDIYQFLNEENGQIAIYDAVNPSAAGRRSLANEFAKHDIEVRNQGCTERDSLLTPFFRHCSSNHGVMITALSRRMSGE